MALKQDCVHFVLCPEQGNKIEGVDLNKVCIFKELFILKRVRVSNPQWLTFTQILVPLVTLIHIDTLLKLMNNFLPWC